MATDTFVIDLALFSPAEWDDLFQLVVDSVRLEYVESAGLVYCNNENEWSDVQPIHPLAAARRDPAGIDPPCTAYLEAESCSRRALSVQKDPVNFFFSFQPDLDRFGRKKTRPGPTNAILSSLMAWCQAQEQPADELPGQALLNNIWFRLDTLTLFNSVGVNHDHRGSDHVAIRLPWAPQTDLNGPFTMKQLADAVFTLKSHKWDNNYEMFCSSTVTFRDGHCQVGLVFDHGS